MTPIERADRTRHVSCLAQVRDEIPGFVTLRTRNARFRPIIVTLKYWGSLKLRLCWCKWDMKPGQQWAEECSDAGIASEQQQEPLWGEMSLGNSWWVFVTGMGDDGWGLRSPRASFVGLVTRVYLWQVRDARDKLQGDIDITLQSEGCHIQINMWGCS